MCPSKEGGGVTVCPSKGTHQIGVSFSPSVVDYLLEKAHKRGGGGIQTPQDPLATPLIKIYYHSVSVPQ